MNCYWGRPDRHLPNLGVTFKRTTFSHINASVLLWTWESCPKGIHMAVQKKPIRCHTCYIHTHWLRFLNWSCWFQLCEENPLMHGDVKPKQCPWYISFMVSAHSALQLTYLHTSKGRRENSIGSIVPSSPYGLRCYNIGIHAV